MCINKVLKNVFKFVYPSVCSSVMFFPILKKRGFEILDINLGNMTKLILLNPILNFFGSDPGAGKVGPPEN